MLGMNAVALVFFSCINVAAYQLCKCPEDKRKKIVYKRYDHKRWSPAF